MERTRKHRVIEIIILLLMVLFLVELVQTAGNSGVFSAQSRLYYIKNKIMSTMVDALSPNLMYPMAETAQGVDDLIIREFPVLAYMKKNGENTPVVENEGTYELILKGEANDENFVDEEGKVVIVSEQNEEGQKEPTQVPKEHTEISLNGTKVQELNWEFLKDEEYIKKNYYTIDRTTYVQAGEIDGEKFMQKDFTIKAGPEAPQILIFHTHSQESFVDSVPGDSSTTIVGVGAYLAELLREKYNFNVIHNTKTYDLVDGNIDRNKAYSLAEPDIKEILKANPTIEVILDIHRDAMNESTHLVTDVGGKPTARFMFFNGMSRTTTLGEVGYLPNPYREDNMAFAFQMQMKGEEYYPGLTRRIYLKGYRYNLHLLPKTMLVEVGAQNNTLQEEKNAMEPLAHMLFMVLKGE
ncbi:MAG: stage II sporulation protein P [Lachnospiraceae bacterium]|nr:stage II sporulation protein P [Lachnospiraceae bacterium]